MHNISEQTLKNAYKPYDIVSDEYGNVGFIQETNMNSSQNEPIHQISYSVQWLVRADKPEWLKNAWFSTNELTRHCNLFVKIAECSCHPFGENSRKVAELMATGI